MSIIEEKVLELDALLKSDLGVIELDVTTNYTLADAIREGCKVTTQARGWGDGTRACALSAAVIAGKNRGLIG